MAWKTINNKNSDLEDFRNQISKEVKNHPTTQFQDLGSVTEQNYEKRLARVFNKLSKNSIIPIDNNDSNKPSENDVKQWMVENSGVMNGSVFIQDLGNDGKLKKAKMPSSTPISAGDITIENVGGGGRGVDSNKPPSETITSVGTTTYDVSNVVLSSTFVLKSGGGEDGRYSGTQYGIGTSGASGYRATIEVNTAILDQIVVEYQQGQNGTRRENVYSHESGDGGDGVRLTDGNGTTIAKVSGGGGGWAGNSPGFSKSPTPADSAGGNGAFGGSGGDGYNNIDNDWETQQNADYVTYINSDYAKKTFGDEVDSAPNSAKVITFSEQIS